MKGNVVIKEVLEEYRTRLGIDGSANILATEPDIAETIVTWCEDHGTVHLPTLTIPKATTAPDKWPYGEDVFTHIFAPLDSLERASLQMMKLVQYSLKWKGIAVIFTPLGSQYESSDIVNLLEDANFERGRIRVLDREVRDEKSTTATVVLAMKWDMLYG